VDVNLEHVVVVGDHEAVVGEYVVVVGDHEAVLRSTSSWSATTRPWLGSTSS
jgi:hypothetical protein